jgi:hypothetical protein
MKLAAGFAICSSERLLTSTGLLVVISQEIELFIATAVRTSNLKYSKSVE